MIKVVIKTNTMRRDVTAEPNATPRAIFDDFGVDTSGSVVNLNGTILSATDLNSTFEALGVSDGSTVNLNSIVKADGANN